MKRRPSILSASDATLELNNVLNPAGVLRLTGSHLHTVQSQFASISASEILVVPHIPAQTNAWTNEYDGRLVDILDVEE